ncbi:MAG: hypothetical protein IJD25_03490 [Alphaproteobacteria bacterium]|nr:hypothetical protein [Alphaproteobacteria bacterium]
MNQRSALEMILAQPKKGGMSKSAILLHQKQCEDFEKMQKEINSIKEDVKEMKAEQGQMHQKLDALIELSKKKTSFKENIKEILNNKVFLYLLITLMCALFGVSAGEVGLKILE